MISGGTPASAKPMSRPMGSTPSSFTMRSLMTTAAAAPSDFCEALPAVTVPFTLKTGRRAASASRLVSRRGPSSTRNSFSTVRVWPFS